MKKKGFGIQWKLITLEVANLVFVEMVEIRVTDWRTLDGYRKRPALASEYRRCASVPCENSLSESVGWAQRDLGGCALIRAWQISRKQSCYGRRKPRHNLEWRLEILHMFRFQKPLLDFLALWRT